MKSIKNFKFIVGRVKAEEALVLDQGLCILATKYGTRKNRGTEYRQ